MAKASTSKRKAAPPWKKKRPKGPRVKLTKEEIGLARARAKAGGRRYPNLVDNMAIAKRKRAAAKAD
jgi:hypothetical protein